MPHREHLGCRWFEEFWNQRDPETISRLCTPDVVAHGADGQTRRADDLRAWHAAMTTAMPDLRIQVLNCTEGNGHAAVHWRATGTHTGNAPGLPATGGRVELDGISLMRMEGTKIAEAWDGYDAEAVQRALGMA